MLYILLLLLPYYIEATYCATGCANSACTCPTFFFYCDSTQDPIGICTLTSI